MEYIGAFAIIIATNQLKMDLKKYLSGLETYQHFQKLAPGFLVSYAAFFWVIKQCPSQQEHCVTRRKRAVQETTVVQGFKRSVHSPINNF